MTLQAGLWVGFWPSRTADHTSGQVENAEMETEVWKRKYGNGNTEVRRKAVYRCLVHECALSNGRAGGNGTAGTVMAVPVFEGLTQIRLVLALFAFTVAVCWDAKGE